MFLLQIDRLFLWVRSKPFFYRFTLFVRILLAAGFLPTGMVKLAGERFTLIEETNPIGAFFEAMYQTGMYWQFLGLSQMLAGALLLFPAWAHLGAALFLPIMVNIFVITISLDFGGTPVVTGLMLLAVVYLCAWDYHRFRPMLDGSRLVQPQRPVGLDPWERLGFTLFTLALIAFFTAGRFFGNPTYMGPCLLIGFTSGLLTLGRFLWLTLRRRLTADSLQAT